MRFRSYFRKRKICVIGCGRSGTGFISRRLAQLGLEIGHEKFGKHGMVSWMSTIHSKKALDETYKLVLHQVRNPLACISSLQSFNSNSWAFIEANVPQIDSTDPVPLKAIKYWYHWNELAEKKTSFRVRVEDFDEYWPFICRILDKELINSAIDSEAKVNSREGKYDLLDWDTIQTYSDEYFQKVRQLAEAYGYDVD